MRRVVSSIFSTDFGVARRARTRRNITEIVTDIPGLPRRSAQREGGWRACRAVARSAKAGAGGMSDFRM